MLLSKRPEMFLPNIWPTYFSKTKGCYVWDLSGNKYTDISLMGVGTNVLGYNNPFVDGAVKKVIKAGNLSTLNCPEEVYLAERLTCIHKFADMARLCRTGGEANAVAIRIARAATGRDDIAVCGYHGWHDWYLAANLQVGDSLAGHLLPGLDTAGVPQCLSGTTHTFNYNEFNELEKIVKNNKLAAIKMEVVRNQKPQKDFLRKVRELANKNNIVLIFDECTTGFRQTFGGIYQLHGVEPDIAIFGKTLGNGYAITAVIGKKEIMDVAQNTFISSTFWTERIGPTAALASLSEMEKVRSWEIVNNIGLKITDGWRNLAQNNKIKISINGIPSLCSFSIPNYDNSAIKTFISQEMLRKGFLAGMAVYPCVAHSDTIVESYLDALNSTFEIMKLSEHGTELVEKLLDGPVCHSGFSRLN